MNSSVKQQVIEDLQMAGLSPGTQKTYLEIIVRFVNRTRIRPQDATEAQVAEYLRGLIQSGLCQGTIKPIRVSVPPTPSSILSPNQSISGHRKQGDKR